MTQDTRTNVWRRVGDAARTLGDALATPRGAAPGRAVAERGDAARALLSASPPPHRSGDEDARDTTGRLPYRAAAPSGVQVYSPGGTLRAPIV